MTRPTKIIIDPKYAKCPPQRKAAIACCEALNMAFRAKLFRWDDSGLEVFTDNFSLPVALNEERTGACILVESDDPDGRRFVIKSINLGGESISVLTFSLAANARLDVEASDLREGELKDSIEKLKNEVARRTDQLAIQQREHENELEATRMLLRSTQDKLREARRKLVGLEADNAKG